MKILRIFFGSALKIRSRALHAARSISMLPECINPRSEVSECGHQINRLLAKYAEIDILRVKVLRLTALLIHGYGVSNNDTQTVKVNLPPMQSFLRVALMGCDKIVQARGFFVVE